MHVLQPVSPRANFRLIDKLMWQSADIWKIDLPDFQNSSRSAIYFKALNLKLNDQNTCNIMV